MTRRSDRGRNQQRSRPYTPRIPRPNPLPEDRHFAHHFTIFIDQSNGHGFSSHTQPSHNIVRNAYRNGSRVPDYKAKIAHHQDASSTYDRWEQRIESKEGTLNFSFKSHENTPPNPDTTSVSCEGCIAAFEHGDYLGGTAAGLLTFASRALLNVRFLLAVKAVYQSMDGSTFLGELRETLHGIRHPADGLRRGLGAYLSTVRNRGAGLSRRLTRARRVAAANAMIAETWLEASFGWAPLINDIRTAGDAYNSLFDVQFETKRVHAQISEIISDSSHNDVIPPVIGLPYKRHHSFSNSISCRMYGLVVKDTPRPYTFEQRFGLTPENFIPTVWELLPFSFVADYFCNIGACLSAGGVSTKGLRVFGLTTKVEGIDKYVYTPDLAGIKSLYESSGFFDVSVTGTPSEISFPLKAFSREVLDPRDDLFVVPVISLPTQPNRFANMSALLSQAAAARGAIIL